MIKSYKALRQAIGYLALVFPFALILGSWTGGFIPMGVSISSYYWATSHVLFTGMLMICGSFLIFYNGYDFTDNIITTIVGISMIMVSCFPCLGGDNYLFLFLSPEVTNIIHGISATITFSLLGYMSYFQFTKTDSLEEATENKLIRNKVYKVCGIIIFVAIGIIGLLYIIPGAREFTDKIRLFFWLETIILEAFGVSWIVKGEALLGDE